MRHSNNPAHRFALLAASFLIAAQGAALAGPLSPPAGPVAPTGKTTQEIYDKVAQGTAAVEPRIAINAVNTPPDGGGLFKISQPGSYYLAGNITGTQNANVIAITAEDVTVDLNGFRVTSTSTSYDVITSSAARTRIINGTVRGASVGLRLGPSGRVENVSVEGCAYRGIYPGDGSTVIGCNVRSCVSEGIALGPNSLAERCIVRNCGAAGIRTDADCRLISCTSSGNAGMGFQLDGSAEGCIASGNATRGFTATGASILDHCTAQQNITAGFALDSTSIASHCISTGNNTHGFELGSLNCSVIECSASGNAINAVRVVGEGARIINCSLYGVSGFPVVSIDSGYGARVEGNSIFHGTYALAGNGANAALVVGNHLYAQTTGDINANPFSSQVGPISTSVGEITTTNPWANFRRF